MGHVEPTTSSTGLDSFTQNEINDFESGTRKGKVLDMAKFNMNGITSPCQGCSARAMNCWSTCPKYAAFRKKLDRQREERRRASDAFGFCYEVQSRIPTLWRGYGRTKRSSRAQI